MKNKNNFIAAVNNAAKWSFITEIISRLITPFINMILARLLMPEEFGIVTTVTMITSFADIFTNSGFQKYLIQQEFKDDIQKYKSASVAFWANFVISLILWGVIAIFSENLAALLGISGLGVVIIVAGMQIPITSFSSIQTALYRRKFAFKNLFKIRLFTSIIPLIVTIPLALNGYSYWALIIGNICGSLFNSIMMTLKSDWKPNLYFNLDLLRKMFKYSTWSTIDAITLWLTTWIDAFIIGSILTNYYLGVYKTSLNLVNSIFGLITAALTPVLFSTLSRLQNNNSEFKAHFLRIQKITAFCVLPMGFGILVYSDLVTNVMLGSQWEEAIEIIGIWGIVSSFMIVLSNFNSDVFRAKGKPQISVFLQILHMVLVVIACLISMEYGFWILVYTRAFIRFTDPMVSYYFINKICGITYRTVIVNIYKPIICSIIMYTFAIIFKMYSQGIIWDIISILICASIYIISLLVISKDDFNILKNIFIRTEH